MPTEEQTYRVSIEQKLDTMDDRMQMFEKNTGSTLNRIEAQTIKTNGRVNNLENWKGYITGGVAVLTFIVTVLLAVLAIIAQTGRL